MTGYQPPIFDLYQFEYTTVARMRDEGLTDTVTYPDATVRKLIRRFSKVVNRATDQWFWPIEQQVRVDGNGSSLIGSPNLIPILELRGVTYYSEAGSSILSTTDFRISDRDVSVGGTGWTGSANPWQFQGAKFPAGTLNIVLDGTFGWLENRPFVAFDQTPKITTTTTTTTAVNATTTTLTSAVGIQPRAVLVFRTGAAGTSYAGHVIVNTVDTGTGVVTFDAANLNVALLPIGTNVAFYGMVPEPVEDAVIRLVVRFKDKLASAAAVQATKVGELFKESTDAYSYEKVRESAIATSSSLTGDAYADRLLYEYHRPNAIFAV